VTPVVIPATYAVNILTSDYYTVPTQPSVIVISYENVPTIVPTIVIGSVPTSNIVIIAVSSFVVAPSTVRVPSNWVSPVVIPETYAIDILTSNYYTIPS
jgi:hypothetical protein